MLAAVLASARETELGSRWNFEAVLRADCFCAHEVPPTSSFGLLISLEGGGDDVLREPKRDDRPDIEVDEGLACGVGCGGGELDLLMSRPGTDIPERPKREDAAWFRKLGCCC